MPATDARTLRVSGLAELQRAFARADRNVKKDLRSTIASVAEPVAADAHQLAVQEISGLGAADPWAGFRVGVTRTLVYVAPKQRGRLSRRNPRRYIRRKFADFLMDKAMAPALDNNIPEIEQQVGRMLDGVADDWGRGG